MKGSNFGLYVNPIRSSVASNAVLVYSVGEKEITYNTTKNFIIDHPTDESKYLIHACLEGPEAGVYYRGTGELGTEGHVEVELPAYVSAFATDFTVHITSVRVPGHAARLLEASEVVGGKFSVFGEAGPFNWVVYGRRAAVFVEPAKDEIIVMGEGPYKYYTMK